jgi:hypothetical protein
VSNETQVVTGAAGAGFETTGGSHSSKLVALGDDGCGWRVGMMVIGLTSADPNGLRIMFVLTQFNDEYLPPLGRGAALAAPKTAATKMIPANLYTQPLCEMKNGTQAVLLNLRLRYPVLGPEMMINMTIKITSGLCSLAAWMSFDDNPLNIRAF